MNKNMHAQAAHFKAKYPTVPFKHDNRYHNVPYFEAWNHYIKSVETVVEVILLRVPGQVGALFGVRKTTSAS